MGRNAEKVAASIRVSEHGSGEPGTANDSPYFLLLMTVIIIYFASSLWETATEIVAVPLPDHHQSWIERRWRLRLISMRKAANVRVRPFVFV